jgi:hypothetical protein
VVPIPALRACLYLFSPAVRFVARVARRKTEHFTRERR